MLIFDGGLSILMTLRVFHGPGNIAGIGRYLADWQWEQGMTQTLSLSMIPRLSSAPIWNFGSLNMAG